MATSAARRLVAFLDREALGVVVAVAVFALFSLAVIPQMLVQDTWLTLVSGREIFLHGLQEVDDLTVWARGSTWIDQQWLAQLLFFWTHEVGRYQLVALAHVGAVVAAIASAIAAARSFGASSLAVSLVAAPGDLRRAVGFSGACADVRDPHVRLARVVARRRQSLSVAAGAARLSAARPLGELAPGQSSLPRRSLPCAGSRSRSGESTEARKPVEAVAPARPCADLRSDRVPRRFALRARPRHVLPDDARELDAQDVRERVGPRDAVTGDVPVFRARLRHRWAHRPVRSSTDGDGAADPARDAGERPARDPEHHLVRARRGDPRARF